MTADVLFLCPHNAAKGVIAAAFFNDLARREGLHLSADSAGTEPSSEVSPAVVAMLAAEGIDVSGHQPRLVTAPELQAAARIISMGCTPEELGVEAGRIELWNDIPTVSAEPERARQAIRERVRDLILELRSSS